MKTIKLTDPQVVNFVEFFEFEFIPSVQRNTDCDNINYLVDMCDIYKKLKYEKSDLVEVVRCKDCRWYLEDVEWCYEMSTDMCENDFCNYGERKGESE